MELIKLKNKKSYYGFIPDDWILCKFQDVLAGFSSGMTPYRGTPEFYRGNIPWITSGELNYNVIKDTVEKITEDAVVKTNLKKLPIGTFLMAITGLEAKGTRGSCGITGIEATTNQSCMALFPKESHIVIEYLYHFYVKYGDELAFKFCQGTKQQSYTGKIVKILPINLPPTLKEQKAIATALSDVDALIHSLEALIAKKKAIKQGAMQELLTGKTRLAGFENEKGYQQTEVGLIPVDWEVKTLGELGECIIGLTYSPSNVSKSGVLVLRSSNIQGNQLAFHDNVYVDMKIPDKLRTKKGDILVCVRNGSRRLIGKCAVIDRRCTNETFGAFMSMYRSEYNDFIAHAFQSYSIQRQIEENLGATINQITNKTLNSFVVSMPRSNEERRSIAKILSEFDQEIQALESKKEKYQGIKQGMMQELLTGKTRLI